jgi:hypothetical protein
MEVGIDIDVDMEDDDEKLSSSSFPGLFCSYFEAPDPDATPKDGILLGVVVLIIELKTGLGDKISGFLY